MWDSNNYILYVTASNTVYQNSINSTIINVVNLGVYPATNINIAENTISFEKKEKKARHIFILFTFTLDIFIVWLDQIKIPYL